jgi:hypothetical protein
MLINTRPEVVETVRACAYDGILKAPVPDDVTSTEEAEGLISLAVERLRSDLDAAEAARLVLAMVEKQLAS